MPGGGRRAANISQLLQVCTVRHKGTAGWGRDHEKLLDPVRCTNLFPGLQRAGLLERLSPGLDRLEQPGVLQQAAALQKRKERLFVPAVGMDDAGPGAGRRVDRPAVHHLVANHGRNITNVHV